jgi:hypothetical protein
MTGRQPQHLFRIPMFAKSTSLSNLQNPQNPLLKVLKVTEVCVFLESTAHLAVSTADRP